MKDITSLDKGLVKRWKASKGTGFWGEDLRYRVEMNFNPCNLCMETESQWMKFKRKKKNIFDESFSTNDVGTTTHPHARMGMETPTFHSSQQLLKMD